jgi:hypothetical protein
VGAILAADLKMMKAVAEHRRSALWLYALALTARWCDEPDLAERSLSQAIQASPRLPQFLLFTSIHVPEANASPPASAV